MCGRVAFLAVLVWFFSAESRTDTFISKITRDHLDSFTNDFCGPCSKYDATPSRNAPGSCTCRRSMDCFTKTYPYRGSVYIRSKGKCESSCNLTSSNDCYFWGNQDPFKVIDLEDLTSAHEFFMGSTYLSCTWRQTIAYLDASGNWEQVNLSANAFQVLPVKPRHQLVKVNQRSASLTKLGGHVLKLGLNCIQRNNEIIPKCLVFKAKGELNFTLCNYTVTTTTSPPPPSSSTTTVTSTVTPSSINTTTTPSSKPPLLTIDFVLTCLALGAIVMSVCYFKRESIWKLCRREGRDFADNRDQQTYRRLEDQEPVYVEQQ